MASSSILCFTSAAKKQLNKSRKRKIKITEWKDNKRKSLRNSGQPYICKRNVAVDIVSRKTLYPSPCDKIVCMSGHKLFFFFASGPRVSL